MKIGTFTLTRESAVWWWGLVAALVTTLATVDADTAMALGISAYWLAKLRLASFLVGVGSAWAKTSMFPSRKDVDVGDRVDVSRRIDLSRRIERFPGDPDKNP